jgi:hypothetical protein
MNKINKFESQLYELEWEKQNNHTDSHIVKVIECN